MTFAVFVEFMFCILIEKQNSFKYYREILVKTKIIFLP